MKSPREVLLARHRQMEPKLDAVRQKALAALPGSQNALVAPSSQAEGFSLGAMLRTFWLELIWPSRRAWAGLAALWLAVLAVNLGMRANSLAGTLAHSTPPREVVRGFVEQQRLLAELLPPAEPAPAPAPPRNEPPRSERPVDFKAA